MGFWKNKPVRYLETQVLNIVKKVHLSGSPGPSKIVKCESPVIDVDMDQIEEIKVRLLVLYSIIST